MALQNQTIVRFRHEVCPSKDALAGSCPWSDVKESLVKPYTVSVEIDLPRAKVIELFDNPDNMFHWQNGLQSYEHLSGQPGQPGAKSKLIYINGKHTIELIETIDRRELPERFDGSYEWGGGRNSLENRFVEIAPERTRWDSTCHYEMRTLFLKAMALLMPGSFKKENLKFMKNFKAFAETGATVGNSAASASNGS